MTTSPALDRPVSELGLPTRVITWAKYHGVKTLRDLVARDRRDLANERNLGRTSLRQTDAVIAGLLGCSWDEAHARLRPPRSAFVDASAMEPPSVEFARKLAQVRETALIEVDLPVRLRNHAARLGITTVGGLWDLPREQLQNVPNLGPVSIDEGYAALRAFIGRARLTAANEVAAAAEPPDFISAWKTVLGALPVTERMVLTQRSGFVDAPQTLQEISEVLGVSRERVRQRELKAIERIVQHSHLVATMTARLGAATGGRVSRLADLANDPWWSGVAEARATLGYVLDKELGGPWRVAEFERAWYVLPADAERLTEAWDGVRAQLDELHFPVPLTAIRALIDSAGARVAPGVSELFMSLLSPELHLATADEGAQLVVAIGEDRCAEMLALLRTSDRPLHRDEIGAKVGRYGRMPDELWYFGRGMIGLEQHFPESAKWSTRLVPRCLQIMEAEPADRQWAVLELFDELREERLLPAWLTGWHLGSLLRHSGKVRWLGRQRLKLLVEGDDGAARVHYRELIDLILREAGGPLDESEIKSRGAARTGATAGGISQALWEPVFVQIEAHRWGLLDRDLPGGFAAALVARERMFDALDRSQRGLTEHELWRAVVSLSRDHARWTAPMALTALRSDARFWIASGGRIGLADWDSVRVPIQVDRVASWVNESGGRLAFADFTTRFTEVYGAVPARNALLNLLYRAGAQLDGDNIVPRAREAAEPRRGR